MAHIAEAHLELVGAVGGDQNVLQWRVTYTVDFRDEELRIEWEDATRLREHDPGDDDLITAYPIPTKFTPTLSRIERSHNIVVFRDQLNTELGTEEIQGEVWLRRVGNQLANQEVITPIVKFDA
jgi:hypothetical protein